MQVAIYMFFFYQTTTYLKQDAVAAVHVLASVRCHVGLNMCRIELAWKSL